MALEPLVERKGKCKALWQGTIPERFFVFDVWYGTPTRDIVLSSFHISSCLLRRSLLGRTWFYLAGLMTRSIPASKREEAT
eukprot:scaffold2655_cov179-Amphora_coffeaeformis.AAC.16